MTSDVLMVQIRYYVKGGILCRCKVIKVQIRYYAKGVRGHITYDV